MSLLSVFLLSGAMFLLAVTPGPGVLATVARALASGFRPAAMVVLGIVAGDLLFLLLAIFGLGALAAILGELFSVVKYLGAAYLVWLGLRLWFSEPAAPDDTRLHSGPGATGNLISGLLITLANPKVILFYLGLLPTFIDLQRLTLVDTLITMLVVSTVLGATLLGYALAAARARQLLRSRRAARLMNRAAGSAMLGAGTALALKA
jgi:threonine/homoserine/homoserine lactone efflux protein